MCPALSTERTLSPKDILKPAGPIPSRRLPPSGWYSDKWPSPVAAFTRRSWPDVPRNCRLRYLKSRLLELVEQILLPLDRIDIDQFKNFLVALVLHGSIISLSVSYRSPGTDRPQKS